MNAWVIEKPELQSAAQKFVQTILTLLIWGFWVYLWLPLLSPWAEDLGISPLLQHHLLQYAGFEYLLTLVIICSIASIIIAIVLGSWALYNKKAFGHSRRRAAQRANKAKIAHYFKVSEDDMRFWQNGRSLYVTHAPDGHIEKVHMHDMGYVNNADVGELEPIPQADIFKNLFR